MNENQDARNFIEEDKVQGVAILLENASQIFQDMQGSFIDTKQERDEIKTKLRENLAKNKSFRRKDFDSMMEDVIDAQNEKEKMARTVLNEYLEEQKEITGILRQHLAAVRDALSNGEMVRVREFHELIQGILKRQDERKNEVACALREFQKEQREMANNLRELLIKGRELRIKDLKAMLKKFKNQQQDREAQRIERRRGIINMLNDFRKERMEGSKKDNSRRQTNREIMSLGKDI